MCINNQHTNENQHKRNCLAVDKAVMTVKTRKNYKKVIHAKRITKESLVHKSCCERDAVNLFFAFLALLDGD